MVAIVNIAVSQQPAPYPSQLQRTGAAVSQGGTITAPGTVSFISQLSDATPLYKGGVTITAITWVSGVATVTLAAAHGITVGDTVLAVIAGNVPTGFNTTAAITATGANTFTYAVAANPGTPTTFGMMTLEDVSELCAMLTTFYAQGSNQGVYVLELGTGTVNEGVATLSAYIIANQNSPQPLPGSGTMPSRFYGYMVPRPWDGNAAFLTLLQSYQNPSSMLYFWVTTTLGTFMLYTSLNKCVVSMIESPAYGTWPQNAVTAATPAGQVVTATTTTPHTVAVGQWFQLAGFVPIGYNGYFQAQPGTTGSTLVFNTLSTLAAVTTQGTLVASYSSNAGINPAAEFSIASAFRVALNYKPSATNKVTPFAFSFLYGVTPFPVKGNSALLTTLKNASVNIVDTAAEGGLSNTMLKWGTTQDGKPFTYWYSVDWHQINLHQDLAAAVILGSNNPINPLYYGQTGINTLQGVAATRFNIGVSFGLGLFNATQTGLDGPALDDALNAGTYNGYAVVNAVPFITYSQENPDDYALETYSGFLGTYTPQAGFTNIQFNITVSDFVAAGG